MESSISQRYAIMKKMAADKSTVNNVMAGYI